MKDTLVSTDARSGEWLDLFRHSLAVAVAVVRDDGQLVSCNEGFRRLLRLRGDAESNDVAAFFVQPAFATLVASQAESGRMIHSGALNVGDSTLSCCTLRGAVHRDRSNLIVVAEHDVVGMERLNSEVVALNEQLTETQRDLARNGRRLRASEASLRELSATDPLTGLANRRRLDEFMANEWQRGARHGMMLSVVAVDIDHFKRVNDGHGHDAGDEVLRHVANLLHERMRSTDVVARVGGEEFVVVLPHADIDGAMTTAERLRVAVQGLRPPPLAYHLSASFGVAAYQVGDTPRSLLAHADAALYAAKNAGRNRVECCIRRTALPASALPA